MRIAQLAPTYERVPPRLYGGTELVVSLLTEELVRRGHDVTLFASADSRTTARLRSVVAESVRYGEVAADDLRHPEHLHLANAQACFLEAARGAFDLVHNHAGIEGMALAASSSTPVLSTMHNAHAPATRPIWDAYPWFHHAVSAASATTFPEHGALPPIHHGLDLSGLPFGDRPDGYLVFLGRFSPFKGAFRAIEAARKAGRRIVLAGKIDAHDARHVATTIQPLIDGDSVIYIGEVDAARKGRLLSRADALLFPIEWDEPFGLVMIEALACGTPVIGFRRASVPEVVENGVNGFVVDDVEGMVRAIGQLGAIDRRRCRASAQRRFSVTRMADDYERAYATVLASARPGPLVGGPVGQAPDAASSSEEAAPNVR